MNAKRPLSATFGRFLAAGNLIPCTGCRYCVDGCPKHIAILELFAAMNDRQMHPDGNADYAAHRSPDTRGVGLREMRQVRASLPASICRFRQSAARRARI